MRFRTLAAILLALVTITASSNAQHLSADGAPQTFNFLTEQYFHDVYFKFSPTAGTSAGLHEYDTQLEDYSAAGMQKNIAALHDYEKKFMAIDPKALDQQVAAYAVLAYLAAEAKGSMGSGEMPLPKPEQ